MFIVKGTQVLVSIRTCMDGAGPGPELITARTGLLVRAIRLDQGIQVRPARPLLGFVNIIAVIIETIDRGSRGSSKRRAKARVGRSGGGGGGVVTTAPVTPPLFTWRVLRLVLLQKPRRGG